MEAGWRRVPGWLPPAELERWLGLVESRRELLAPVAVKWGMNLPYHVLDGLALRRHLPGLAELAAGPLRRAAEEAAGVPLELMRDDKRNLRLQCYRAKGEGFRWHVDGGFFSALLTLSNGNDGGTEVLGPAQSRWLRPVPYLLFPFPRLLELAGPVAVPSAPGDLLLIRGGELIHRGVTRRVGGERIVLAVSYDPVGRVRSALWDGIARRLNY